jgi:hypothetical protein
MKKKIRKFQEGGFSAEQEEWLGGADRTDPYILARMRRAVPDKPMALKENLSGSEELRDETGATSKIRRNTETGDLYSTEAPTPKPSVAKPSVKPAASKLPAMPQEEKDRLAALEKKQALTPVRPEEYLIGGGGAALKVLQMAGKKLAGKIAGNRELKEYVVPKLPAPSSGSGTPALPSPTPKLPYDKAGALAKKRADRAEMRDKTMREENAARYGVTDTEAPGYEALRGSMMRKGGKVKTKPKTSYKSGGSVKSSASKRADGCAIRGKTRA